MEVVSSCPILSLGRFRPGKHGLLGTLRAMLRLSGLACFYMVPREFLAIPPPPPPDAEQHLQITTTPWDVKASQSTANTKCG